MADGRGAIRRRARLDIWGSVWCLEAPLNVSVCGAREIVQASMEEMFVNNDKKRPAIRSDVEGGAKWLLFLVEDDLKFADNSSSPSSRCHMFCAILLPPIEYALCLLSQRQQRLRRRARTQCLLFLVWK